MADDLKYHILLNFNPLFSKMLDDCLSQNHLANPWQAAPSNIRMDILCNF